MSKRRRRKKQREIVYRVKVDWDVWKRDDARVDAFAHVTFFTFDGAQRFALTPQMMASMPGLSARNFRRRKLEALAKCRS